MMLDYYVDAACVYVPFCIGWFVYLVLRDKSIDPAVVIMSILMYPLPVVLCGWLSDLFTLEQESGAILRWTLRSVLWLTVSFVLSVICWSVGAGHVWLNVLFSIHAVFYNVNYRIMLRIMGYGRR